MTRLTNVKPSPMPVREAAARGMRGNATKRYPPGTWHRVAKAALEAREKGLPEIAAVGELLGITRSAAQGHYEKAKRMGLLPGAPPSTSVARTVRVDEETWKRAKDIASARHITVSALILQFLRSLDYDTILKPLKGADPETCIHDITQKVEALGIELCLSCKSVMRGGVWSPPARGEI